MFRKAVLVYNENHTVKLIESASFEIFLAYLLQVLYLLSSYSVERQIQSRMFFFIYSCSKQFCV